MYFLLFASNRQRDVEIRIVIIVGGILDQVYFSIETHEGRVNIEQFLIEKKCYAFSEMGVGINGR